LIPTKLNRYRHFVVVGGNKNKIKNAEKKIHQEEIMDSFIGIRIHGRAMGRLMIVLRENKGDEI